MMRYSKVVDLHMFIAVLKMRKHARKGRPLVVNLEKGQHCKCKQRLTHLLEMKISQ